MSIDRILERAKNLKRKETIWLIPILILACLLTFYPHLNYPYLLHVDEWFHVAQAKQVVLGSDINWYTGENFTLGMERAWHMFLALIYFLFRPSITQWVYLPTILHVLAVLSVYYFVSKLYSKKEALISSLLTALIPSNVTMGGPVFLIPINLSLIFIPLALLFAFRLTKIKTIYNYLLLFIIITFLLYAHPPTAMVLLMILGFYLLLNFFSKDNECRQKAKSLFITMILSIIISLPNYLLEMQKKGFESVTFNFWFHLQGTPLIYGVLPTIFFIIGFYFLTKTEKKETWCLLLTSIFLILNVFLFTRSGSSYIIPYQRTYIPLFLLMSIIASHGYTKLFELRKINKKLGVILVTICLIATTGMAVNNNINTPYYHLIDNKDYENFLWIKDNSPSNVTVLLNPWKARALAPIAERRVYVVMPFGPNKEQMKLVSNADDFLSKNCTNTSFLIENNITVVYTTGNCENPDLIQVKDNIYFLKQTNTSSNP